jgi:glycosidase
MLLLTLRGTPTLYYGDELGIGNVDIPPDRIQDPQAIRDPGSPTRDAYRTPMQWASGDHAGFSEGRPWLPLSPDHETRNVEVQREDPRSMLSLYRDLIRLRRERSVLRRGLYEPVPGNGPVLMFVRAEGEDRVLVAINLSDEPSTARPDTGARGEVLFSTAGPRDRVDGVVRLAGNEGVIVALEP